VIYTDWRELQGYNARRRPSVRPWSRETVKALCTRSTSNYAP